MSVEVSRGAGRPRDGSLDAQILSATVELLLEEQDPESVSISAVVKRAGVSRTALYSRWPSREALLAAALDTARVDVVFPLTGDPVADVVKFCKEHEDASPHFQDLLEKRQILMMRSPKLRELYRREYMGPRREVLNEGIEAMVADGDLSPDVPVEAMADIIYGIHYLHLLVLPREAVSWRRLEAAIELALRPWLLTPSA